MSENRHNADDAGRIEAEASAWLARCDRELTPTEQDEYLQWLRRDPRHGRAFVQLGATWHALEALSCWRPEHSAVPNPDLLAQRTRARRWRFLQPAALALAAAAVIAVGAFSFSRFADRQVAPPVRGVRVIPRPESIVLTDGSVVQLNDDGKIETDFTPDERRVTLVRGEAHFTVTKNPARPFVVRAGSVAVRAVGTAFEVRRVSEAVEVLVTEGKVHVERPTVSGAAPAATALIAGERTSVDTATRAAPPVVTTVSPGEIERTLAWQGVRLEFAGLPLSEVVAEFNLRNPDKVLIADADVANLRVGGTFRADNVEGFVRLLEASFGVTAAHRADGATLLRRLK